MDRRTFLKTAAGAGALATGSILTAPAISQRAGVRALRLVPHADLANFDPIWTTAYKARNAGLLVWDMLYGVDSKLLAATANGGIGERLIGRTYLDFPAARRTQIP